MNSISPKYGSTTDRIYDDIYKLTQPNGTNDVTQTGQKIASGSFLNDSFTNTVDAIGTEYSGSPLGGSANFTDIDNGRNLQFASNVIQTQRQYYKQLITFLKTVSVDGISELLQQKEGLPPATAYNKAITIFNKISASKPLFLSSIEKLDSQLASTQANLQTQKDLNQSNVRSNQQQIKQIVDNFSQAS